MTEQELQAIKERVAAATPGPWYYNNAHVATKEGVAGGYPPNEASVCELYDGEYIENKNGVNDARFIAHARQDVPVLVEEVERLRKALEFYADEKNYIEEHKDPFGAEKYDSSVTLDEGEIARKALEGGK